MNIAFFQINTIVFTKVVNKYKWNFEKEVNILNILIIGHYGISENTPRSFRTIELAKELVRRNHTVDIIEGKNKKIH